jgi:hypothetical protein
MHYDDGDLTFFGYVVILGMMTITAFLGFVAIVA